MQLSKPLLIGQAVFLTALAAVVVIQVKKPAAPPKAPAVHGEVKPAEPGEAEHGTKPGGHGDKGHNEKGAPAAGHGEKKKEAAHGEHGKPAPGPHPLGDDPKGIARALLAGNDRFATGNQTPFDLTAQREAAADGQHPAAMVLGCADSRVAPELIFDRGLGELFVVRSAGNIAEPVAVGSLEYAAEHLHAKVIVILGHDKCGAVQAAMGDAKMPTESLKTLVSYVSPALKGLKNWADGSDLVRLGVEANVRRQADELLRRSPLLRKAVQANEITLLRAVYDLHTGRVRPL
jgi:carbonic anhydrase